MKTKISYLFQSQTGWFEYRRKVPKRLSAYFPKGKQKEWKKSLDTKDATTAQFRWVQENKKFENAKALAEKLLEKPDELLSSEIIQAANRIVTDAGLHPDQAPILRPNHTKQDYEKFLQDTKDWKDNFDLLVDSMDEETIDYEQMQRDYESGEWGKSGYTIPRKELDQRNPLSVAYDIASGERHTTLKPSWRDAVELYIRTNKADNRREEIKEVRWERSTRRLMERFARQFGGMDVELEKLDRQVIRDWLHTFGAGTGNRYNNQLSAVINTWNRENKETIHNPFSGLSNKKLEKEEATNRRSFKPEEWFAYLEKVLEVDDIELKIITLIMLYTGCRTNEAAGVEVRDIKIEDNMPHIVFRTNNIRRMDKDGLERAVPLLTPVLEALRGYNLPEDKKSAAFPRYGHTKGFDNVSVKQRNILNNEAGIKVEEVTPYSSRHTFKDRGIAAGIRADEREYIMGHKGDGSSAMHKKYGTMTPPEFMFESMVKIYNTHTWGYYED